MRRRYQNFEKDHLRAGQGTWAALDRLFGLILRAERGVALAREYHGRHIAHQYAEEARKIIEEGIVSGRLQNDELGTLADLEALGMLEPLGPLLGFFEGRRVYMGQSSMHLSVQGLTGTGKFTTFCAPNLIHMAQTGCESSVYIDIKNAEANWLCGPGIEKITGRQMDRINPFGMHGKPSAKINPMDGIARAAAMNRAGVVDVVAGKMHVVFGERIASAGVNSWIPTAAKLLCETKALYDAHHDPRALTPGGMWDFSRFSHAEFKEYMAEATQSDACDGYIALNAKKLLDQYGREHTQQFDWVQEVIGEAWALYGRGSHLRAQREKTEVDFAEYKKEPRQAVLMWPDTLALSHATDFTMVLDHIIETIARAEGPVRTSIYCEEFASWPKCHNMLKFLRMYREMGIRLIFIAQDRGSYLAYKDVGGFEPFEENSWSLMWGVKNAAHRREIESRAGSKSVIVPNASASHGYQAEGQSEGGRETTTPILPASRIGQICEGQAILDIPGQKVFVIDRVNWWDMPDVAPFVVDKRRNPIPPWQPK